MNSDSEEEELDEHSQTEGSNIVETTKGKLERLRMKSRALLENFSKLDLKLKYLCHLIEVLNEDQG